MGIDILNTPFEEEARINISQLQNGIGSMEKTSFMFGDDGTLLFVTSNSNKTVALDQPPSGFTLENFSFADFSDTSERSVLRLGNGGSKLYQHTPQNNDIKEFVLQNNNRPSGGRTLVSQETLQSPRLEGFHFRNGSELFAFFNNDAIFRKYNLSTPWDISTRTIVAENSVSSISDDHFSMRISDDGKKIYLNDISSNKDVTQLTMDSAWDLSNINLDGKKGFQQRVEENSQLEKNSTLLNFDSLFREENNSGYIIFENESDEALIVQIKFQPQPQSLRREVSDGRISADSGVKELGDTIDLINGSFSESGEAILPAKNDTYASTIAFNGDGSKLYVSSSDSNFEQIIDVYNLSTPWDITNVSHQLTYRGFDDGEEKPFVMRFGNEGEFLYIHSFFDPLMRQFELSTPYDITTSNLFATNSIAEVFQGFSFRNSTELYVCTFTNSNELSFRKYILSTPWDISTMSLSVENVLTSSSWFEGHSMDITEDGKKIYATERTRSGIYQYSLSTAWDISESSLSFDGFVDTNSIINPEPYSVRFNLGLGRMYISSDISGDEEHKIKQLDFEGNFTETAKKRREVENKRQQTGGRTEIE